MTMTAPIQDWEVRELPPLNRARIASAAEDWVKTQMEGVHTAEARTQRASDLIHELEPDLDHWRALRDETACSLSLYWWVRRGANIPGAIGTNRNRLKKIREQQAEKHGFTKTAIDPQTREEVIMGDWRAMAAAHADGTFVFPFVENAPDLLSVYAEKTAPLAARVLLLTKIRDAAIAELMRAGWANKPIADLIGRDPSAVSHIRSRMEAAA